MENAAAGETSVSYCRHRLLMRWKSRSVFRTGDRQPKYDHESPEVEVIYQKVELPDAVAPFVRTRSRSHWHYWSKSSGVMAHSLFLWTFVCIMRDPRDYPTKFRCHGALLLQCRLKGSHGHLITYSRIHMTNPSRQNQNQHTGNITVIELLWKPVPGGFQLHNSLDSTRIWGAGTCRTNLIIDFGDYLGGRYLCSPCWYNLFIIH
jgi:hypothetical protein